MTGYAYEEIEATSPDASITAGKLWAATVSDGPETIDDTLTVTIPDIDPVAVFGPCSWQPVDATTLPARGASCLVAFDNQGAPWVVVWGLESLPAGGTAWLTGSGTPSDSDGDNGDLYLNGANGDVYQKESGSWDSPVGNLEGPAGSTGATGMTGAKGDAGDTGATGPANGESGVAAACLSNSVVAATTPVTFSAPFTDPPTIQVSVCSTDADDDTSKLIASYRNITTIGFEIVLWDTSGSEPSADVSWEATPAT